MFCSKCGKEVRDGDAFCNGCGAKVSVSASSQSAGASAEIAEKREGNKPASFFEKASLMLSGAIMFLSTFLMQLYCESVREEYWNSIAMLKQYHRRNPTYESAREIEVWYNAQSVSETLDVFVLIGAALFVLGIVLFVLECKGKIHKTKPLNLCCFFIPIAVAVIVAIYAYPAIGEYERVFHYENLY